MIQSISVNPPNGIKSYTNVTISAGGSPLDGFPLLSIDRDSYIVQAEIHSGINMRPKESCHCIAIGKGTSVADGVLLMIDLDHDFTSVVQGDLKSLKRSKERRTRQRGSIISSWTSKRLWRGSSAAAQGWIPQVMEHGLPTARKCGGGTPTSCPVMHRSGP